MKDKIVSLVALDRRTGGKYRTILASAAYRGADNIISLLLDRGADINMVDIKYGTALAAAAYQGEKHIVSLLLSRGADTNTVGGEFGTALAAATFRGRTDIVSLLLQHGAGVIHVGGSYLTALDMYPGALGVAHSEDSKADRSLLTPLKTANPNVDSVISRLPFPMPYIPSNLSSLCMSSNLSSPDNVSAKFRAGANITPEQADFPCRGLTEVVLLRSLAALVGLHEDTTQAKCRWARNDVRYFLAYSFDFGLAYAAARIAWNFNDVDPNFISTQRYRWHKHAQILDEMKLGQRQLRSQI